MQIAGVQFFRPTLTQAFWMCSACIVVTLMLYGIHSAIEDGEVKNQPELLRAVMFWPLSLVLSIRIAHAFGLAKNTTPKKILMVFMFFIPVALAESFVVGMQ